MTCRPFPSTRRDALLRPAAARTSIDRQVRLGHARDRNDREDPVRQHSGATIGRFHRIADIRPSNAIKIREASTTGIVQGLEGQGESLLRVLIDEGEALNRLYSVVSQAGYEILLYDERGDVICHYGRATAGAHGASIPEPGRRGVVAENVEEVAAASAAVIAFGKAGANQAAEASRATPSKAFDCRSVAYMPDLDCRREPVFNAEGDVIGYLEALSPDRAMTEGAFSLTRAAVKSAARAIEERSFRRRYRREWIIALVPGGPIGCGILLAVDRRQCVVGADRRAREILSDANVALLDGPSLWTLFEKRPTLFRNADMGDVRTSVVPIGAAEAWPVLVTPPEAVASYRRSPEQAVLHCRPRLDSIRYFHESPSPARSHCGLTPRVFQRVRDYMDAHLSKNVELEALANIAGLSRCHFARAFKQSSGTTPHSYLMQRRVERAKELIVETELALAQIALECGFSDQSHFSRRFLQYVGVTPRSFRWSAR